MMTNLGSLNKKKVLDLFYCKIDNMLDEAYFFSEWVTVIMRGAASVIPIKIFVKIP